MLVLPSRFCFAYDNLYGDGKVTAEDIHELMPRIQAAHEAVQLMRMTGEVKGHLSKDGLPEKVLFTQLPYIKDGNINSKATLSALKEFGREVQSEAEAVIFFGIGGSYLGNKVLFDVQCGDFWNLLSREERQGYPEIYFSGNNIDARHTFELINYIKGKKLNNIVLVVISKSGSTLDTMAAFMVIYDQLKKQKLKLKVVAVTDPQKGQQQTLLHRLAAEQGWQMFSVPDGVGGRFSIFSEVGLITAACIGFDIEAFLAGARDMDKACLTDDVMENPAMLNAVLKYIACEKYGRNIEVFMPYANNLKSVAEWYVQLIAESLGKRYDRQGNEVFYGRTPVVAVGTTDMHAQTQQHQDGRRDKVVQFVNIAEWDKDIVIPDVFPECKTLHKMAGIKMSSALHAALESNAEALTSDNRFNATFTLPALNAYHLGELLYMLALSVAYEGELANVDAFDQPGVENYKRRLGPKLDRIGQKL